MCLIYISLLLNYSKRKISYFSNEILKLKLIYCEIISSNILDNYILINYLIIDFSRGRQPIKTTVYSKYTYVYDQAKRDVWIKQKMR
jgi:hypothetical protein